ncbi:hypothetical protein BVX99_00930 [bacterium F16]|nr:hypothetical protein BVX99_00930 [bacterium F16]
MTKTSNLLFVDDDASVIAAFRRGFWRNPDAWHMDFADSGRGALEILEDRPIDLLITDLFMPGTTGLDLLKECKERFPWTDVVLVTGMPSVEAAIEAFKNGAIQFLTKPIGIDRLRGTLLEALRKRELCRLAPHSPVIETEWAGYTLVGRIAEGGMGTVFLASHADHPQHCAVKIFRMGPTVAGVDAQQQTDRFYREGKIARRIDHPNVIGCHDVGEWGAHKIPFIAFEYFDGLTLESIIRSRQPLSVLEKLMILRQICKALVAVHEVVLCHRDLKPLNVLVDDELIVKLIDFGIVRTAHSELTQADCVLGSPQFMAPEYFSPGVADARADLYAFGVIAYELFTGRAPFMSMSLAGLVQTILNKQPISLVELAPDAPVAVADYVHRLLQKVPTDRFPSSVAALEVLDALINQLEEMADG